MTQQQMTGTSAASFAAHVRAFHAGLPAEEQALLEQVFVLAESAAGEDGDTKGFIKFNEFTRSSAPKTNSLGSAGPIIPALQKLPGLNE